MPMHWKDAYAIGTMREGYARTVNQMHHGAAGRAFYHQSQSLQPVVEWFGKEALQKAYLSFGLGMDRAMIYLRHQTVKNITKRVVVDPGDSWSFMDERGAPSKMIPGLKFDTIHWQNKRHSGKMSKLSRSRKHSVKLHGPYRRSKPGEFPAMETGDLARHTFSKTMVESPSVIEGYVYNTMFYAPILENKLKRSFLKRTLSEQWPEVVKRFRKACQDTLETSSGSFYTQPNYRSRPSSHGPISGRPA